MEQVAVDNQILIDEFKRRLSEYYGERLKGLILFGSEARGEASPVSDVDLLVLLSGPVEMGREIGAIIDCYYPLQLEQEFFRPISALPADADEYEAESTSLYHTIKSEGIIL